MSNRFSHIIFVTSVFQTINAILNWSHYSFYDFWINLGSKCNTSSNRIQMLRNNLVFAIIGASPSLLVRFHIWTLIKESIATHIVFFNLSIVTSYTTTFFLYQMVVSSCCNNSAAITKPTGQPWEDTNAPRNKPKFRSDWSFSYSTIKISHLNSYQIIHDYTQSEFYTTTFFSIKCLSLVVAVILLPLPNQPAFLAKNAFYFCIL